MLHLLAEGIESIFANWTALQLAINGQWGGIETTEKYHWFCETIAEYVKHEGHRLDPSDLEEALEQILSDEFNVQLEDKSAYQVAHIIMNLFLGLSQNQTALFFQLKSKRHNSVEGITTIVNKAQDNSDEDQCNEHCHKYQNQSPESDGWIHY